MRRMRKDIGCTKTRSRLISSKTTRLIEEYEFDVENEIVEYVIKEKL